MVKKLNFTFVKEMENPVMDLCRCNRDKKRITELEDRSIEFP